MNNTQQGILALGIIAIIVIVTWFVLSANLFNTNEQPTDPNLVIIATGGNNNTGSTETTNQTGNVTTGNNNNTNGTINIDLNNTEGLNVTNETTQ